MAEGLRNSGVNLSEEPRLAFNATAAQPAAILSCPRLIPRDSQMRKFFASINRLRDAINHAFCEDMQVFAIASDKAC
jgi:hypothetical protein